jgi:hypothetical protein
MVVGFNHNVVYKGDVFHIQTEDSGINNPHIITLLYKGGNIISSKKTSYADIVKMDNLDQVVEELMKEQHKDMLRRLKSGEFDDRLGLTGTSVSAVPAVPAEATTAAPVPASAPAPAAESDLPLPLATPASATAKQKQSLDDIIFDFLTSGEKK